MDINLNVTINAPELCASLNNLAASLAMSKTTGFVADTTTDKSNFTFKLADTAAAGEPVTHNAETVDLPTTDRNDDATRVEPPAVTDKPETTETTNGNPAQDTDEADSKPATEEPPKEEVQKVELEVIRGILKGKVEAGKKDKVAAFLASYDVKKLTDIPADKFTTEMQAKAEAI